MKLLTIIVPTYNMEAMLPRCLDSLVAAKLSKASLEVLVVNDGSKDGSLAVALGYREAHPEVIRVIDKPNGNYGSTINAGLPKATGKYVKILDSDDWFDTASLDSFLSELESLESKAVSVDVIATRCTAIHAGGKKEVLRCNTMGREPFDYGRVYPVDEVLGSGAVRHFLMHNLTYRTDLLRDMGYRQTEGVSYTDIEWATFPFYKASTMLFLDIDLYRYNCAREGQTMDPKVRLRSLGQLEKVQDSLIECYEARKEELSPVRAEYMRKNHEHRLRQFYRLFLIEMPREDFNPSDMERIEAKYVPVCERNGFKLDLYPDNKIVRIDLVRWWRRHHDRLPKWLETLNGWVDVVVKSLYVRIFRGR